MYLRTFVINLILLFLFSVYLGLIFYKSLVAGLLSPVDDLDNIHSAIANEEDAEGPEGTMFGGETSFSGPVYQKKVNKLRRGQQLLIDLQNDINKLIYPPNPTSWEQRQRLKRSPASDDKNNTAQVEETTVAPELLDKVDFEKYKNEVFDKLRGKNKMKSLDPEANLPAGYNKFLVPHYSDERNGEVVHLPVQARVILNLRSILDIEEDKERITLDMDFLMIWVDWKIINMSFVDRVFDWSLLEDVPSNFIDKLWRPNFYLDNLVKITKMSFMEPPVTLSIAFLTGVIAYKERFVPTVKCGMDFLYYPADTQVCIFSLRSYSYGIEDLIVGWASDNYLGIFLQDPSDANFDLRIDNIEELIVPEELDFANKSYHALRFKLYARRKLSYQLIQTYLPSAFFVIITWLCFLLPSKMIEARLAITMTTLLTLTAMFASVRDSTPAVSYYKAIDIWILMCNLFIFMILVQFSIMAWVVHYSEKENEQRKVKRKFSSNNGPENIAINHSSTKSNRRVPEEEEPSSGSFDFGISIVRLHRYEIIANILDKFGFLFYSVIFLIFTIIYWIWLLMSTGYFNWNVNPKWNYIPK